MQIIYDFLSQAEDFTPEDKQNGYMNVYRPGWHPYPVQFWFNPPYNENNESEPTLSGTIILAKDGEIMIENVYDGLSYNLNDCLETTQDNFADSINDYYRSISL